MPGFARGTAPPRRAEQPLALHTTGPAVSMKNLPRLLYFVLLAGVVSPAPSAAQDSEEINVANGLRVFLECSGMGCDQRNIRTEIDWVNWMRDRQDAQLHVIVTTQTTGSGGSLYTLDFVGRDELEDSDDQLTFTTQGTSVRDEAVRGLTRVLAVGLARYSVLVGAGAPIDTAPVGGGSVGEDLTDRLVTSDQVDDPWNFWVFEVDVSTDLSGETRRKNRRFEGGIEARRTTPTWKFQFEAGGNWRRNEIQLSDSVIVDYRRDWDAEVFAVYALADHWSLGLQSEVSSATRTNQDLSIGVGPGLEYSVWPYAEAPRRSLRAQYRTGVRHFNYEEVTLFGQTEETRPFHELNLFLNQRQTWGSVFANVTGAQYLHDTGKYRLSSGGFLSFRIVRGLNLNVNGRVSWIRDQLFLPAADVSDEEILLERRRLASSFDWDFGVGFRFQFGSIFNNVVNNRF